MFDFPLDHISYIGIIVFLALTGCGLPIPEEVFIVAAGIASSVGTLNPLWAFLSCLVGAVAGDTILYAIGYHFGHSLVYRHPRFARLLHADREVKIEQMIRKHEVKVLFLSRFMVGVRAPVYLAAGVLRIPFLRFFVIDVMCATAVVSLFFGLSYLYGERLTRLIRQSEIALTVVVLLSILAVAGYFLWRRRSDRFPPQPPVKSREECAVGAPDSKEM